MRVETIKRLSRCQGDADLGLGHIKISQAIALSYGDIRLMDV